MQKKYVLFFLLFIFISNEGKSNDKDRDYWVSTMTKIVEPVFTNLSKNQLRAKMPVETSGGINMENGREKVTHLEALGRSFSGISPWLNLGPDETKEGKLRARYIDLCVKSITNAVNPDSPDYMRFDGPGGQPLVDAAFFAHGLLRSKDQIWPRLDKPTQQRVINAMKSSRKIKASQSNWLLFSAMIEAALLEFSGECDMTPIEYAIKKHMEWYKGDGWYGDGMAFHLDYYNSYVIQPMLLDILKELKQKGLDRNNIYSVELKRFTRFADQQEKLISPEGSYPILGRSMAYRFGAFHVLAQTALMKELPEHVSPAQVRCALTKVIKRQLVPESFDKDGWLRIGFHGHQPEIADSYISTGSLYLCTFVFMPLGLDPRDEFWMAAPEEWSSLKAWNGKKVNGDKAISN